MLAGIMLLVGLVITIGFVWMMWDAGREENPGVGPTGGAGFYRDPNTKLTNHLLGRDE